MSKFKKFLYIVYGDIWFVLNATLFLWFNTKPPRILIDINFSVPKLFVVLSAILFIISIIINIKNKKLGIGEFYTFFALISPSILWIRFNIMSFHYIYEFPIINLYFSIPLLIFTILFYVRAIRYIILLVQKKNRSQPGDGSLIDEE